jgi:hypothetical protein
MVFSIAATSLQQVLQASTPEDVEALISAYPEGQWKSLGNREMNFPVVNVGADPGDALVERITNGMDALIEREMVIQGIVVPPSSPRQASEQLFGIPQGRLLHLSETARRRQLAMNLQVVLRDSGLAKRPTVVVEDHGIGQHPDEFENTLLSLNENNKVNRHELLGAFGQGGAAVFAFTPYAIIVSRREPAALKPGMHDEVGWTVVRFNALDENFKYGRYEYLVVPDHSGNLAVPRFPVAALPFERRDFVGCIFTVIAYQLEKFSDTVFQPKASMWLLLNSVLFDPIHPILIRDERPRALRADSKRATEGLVVNGNATRLAEDKRDKIEYENTHEIRLDEAGRALVRCYAVRSKGESKKDWELMANYISPDNAVSITLNGQRQGSMRREVFKRLGLLSVGNSLIVQVDCDGLSRRAKWELFSTTRDRLRESALASRIEAEIRNAIGSDRVLKELDRDRKKAALAHQSKAEAAKINKWLRDAIRSFRKGTVEVYRKVVSSNPEYQLLGAQPLLDEALPPVDRPDGPDTPETKLNTIPTHIRVMRSPVRVPIGGTGVIRLLVDAVDDYVSPEPGVGVGEFTAQLTKGASAFRISGYSALRAGTLKVTVSANKGTPAGDSGRLIFAITRPNDLPLLAEADVLAEVPPSPRAKPAGERSGSEVGPNVQPVDHDGWHRLGNTDEIVASVEEDPTTQEVTIYVYREYPPLMQRLAQEKVTPDQMHSFQAKFVASLALAAWLQFDEARKGESGLDTQVANAELRRAAELFLFTQWVARET